MKFSQTILRLPAVLQEIGYSRSTLYHRIDQGLFTRQIPLGPRCVGWPLAEIVALNAARIAGKSDDDIRALVEALHHQRQHATQQGVL